MTKLMTISQANARSALSLEFIQAEKAMNTAREALEAFDEAPENNVYDDLESAQGSIEDTLYSRAHADCEGSYNVGAEEYTQQFYCDGKLYEAKLEVDYNRYDKQYYYVDEAKFSVSEVEV